MLRTAGFVVGLVVIPVWLFFVLKDRAALPGAVERALPEGWRPDARNVMALFAGVGGRWVRGQLLLGVAIFIATVIGLTILTLIGFGEFGEFTLVLALIAGVLEWFPIIGPIIAAVPAILIGLTISPAAALAAVVVYTAIQQLENNLLVPKVIGDAVETASGSHDPGAGGRRRAVRDRRRHPGRPDRRTGAGPVPVHLPPTERREPRAGVCGGRAGESAGEADPAGRARARRGASGYEDGGPLRNDHDVRRIVIYSQRRGLGEERGPRVVTYYSGEGCDDAEARVRFIGSPKPILVDT